MKVVNPSVEILDPLDGQEILKRIERAGRTAYRSEDRITDTSAAGFVKMLIGRGHESVLEHEKITVRVVCDRGVSHELVRHRIASYTQESTRYCDYSRGKFGSEITVVLPPWWTDCYDCEGQRITAAGGQNKPFLVWLQACKSAESAYMRLRELGLSPQQARNVLPHSLKTEIVATMNLRQWRHFLKLRTRRDVHPQMRQVAAAILNELKRHIPVVFDDIDVQ